MAQISNIVALIFAFIVMAFSSVTAQESPAPAPAPDAGVAYSLPVTYALVVSALMFSVLSIFRH